MYSVILLLIAFVCPFIGGLVALVALMGNRKHWKVNVFCVSFLLAIASYNYVPESSAPDLYRYFEYVYTLRGCSFWQTMRAAYVNSNLYTLQFLVWICNVFSDEHLLPCITTFIVYWTALYCTCRIGVDLNSKWRHVRLCLLIQLALLDWYSITSNIRNMTAFSIGGYAFFRDVYLGKKDFVTVVCYIAPVFLHPTAALIPLVRIILLFAQSKRLQVLSLSLIVFIEPLIELANAYVSKLTSNPIILLLVRKADSYYFDTSSSYGLRVAQSLRSSVMRVIGLSIIAVFCFIAIRRRYKTNARQIWERKADNFIDRTDKFSYLPLIFGVIALSCSFMLRPEYWRFSAAMIIFSGAVLIPFFNDSRPLTVLSADMLCKTLLIVLVPLDCMGIMWQLTWFNAPYLVYKTMMSSPLVYLLSLPLRVFGGS